MKERINNYAGMVIEDIQKLPNLDDFKPISLENLKIFLNNHL